MEREHTTSDSAQRVQVNNEFSEADTSENSFEIKANYSGIVRTAVSPIAELKHVRGVAVGHISSSQNSG